MESPNYAQQLLLQLNQQRSKGLLCDVIIVVENALFRAHKSVLAASSNYFKSLVLHDNLINLDTEMVDQAVFQQILDFIYTGKLLSDQTQADQVPNLSALLTAANYLQLHELACLCESKLNHNGMSLTGSPGGNPLRKQKLLSSLTPFPSSSSSSRKQEEPPPQSDALRGAISHKRRFDRNNKSNLNHKRVLGTDLSKKSLSMYFKAACIEENVNNAHGCPQSSIAALGDCKTGAIPLCPDERDNPTEAENQLLAEGSQVWRRSGKKARSRKERLVNGDVPSLRAGSLSTQGIASILDASKEEEEYGAEDPEQTGDQKPSDSQANYVYRQETFLNPSVMDDLYVCIPCGKGFPTAESLNSHVETHIDEELHVKDEEEDEDNEEEGVECNPPATSQVAPEDSASRPFSCTTCSKSFKDSATLRQHEKTHWLSRPFPCNICGKMFTQRGTMTRHMRSHLGLKPFACEECGMRFTRQYRLTEHMRVHSGEKPYECQLCGSKFTQQRNLISHLRMHTPSS